MELLTVGNSAKLYCLNWIEKFIADKRGEIKILDLGCGEALNFIKLSQLYPQIRYVGIEPSRESYLRAQTHLEGFNARVINSYAYDVREVLHEKFDIVVSFSVLEHVYRRAEYLLSAKECLKEDGYFLINYDAGHFLFPSAIAKLKNVLRHMLAYLGVERYYESFVKENHFLRMIDDVGFIVIDAKFFNIHSLKGIYKIVPQYRQLDYMNLWLEFELRLNELEVDYEDSLVNLFGTRNFVLVHK